MAKDKIIVEYEADVSKIKQQLTGLEKDYKDLDATSTKAANNATDSFNKTAQSANKLGKEVKQSMQAVQDGAARAAKSTGVLQNSVNQLTRELPAFTFSAQIGFLAISNNIPILTDSISRLRAENNALAAEGKPTTSVFKQLAGALFSFNTLISVGVTLFSFYGKEIGDYVTSLFKAKDAVKEYSNDVEGLNERMKDLNKTIDEQYAFQIKLTEARGRDASAIKEQAAVEKLSAAILTRIRLTNDYYITKSRLSRVESAQEGNRASESLALEASTLNKKLQGQQDLINEQLKLEKAQTEELALIIAKRTNDKTKGDKDKLAKELDYQKQLEQLRIDNIQAEQAKEIEQEKFRLKYAKKDVETKYDGLKTQQDINKIIALEEEKTQIKLLEIKEKYKKITFKVLTEDTLQPINDITVAKDKAALDKKLQAEKDAYKATYVVISKTATQLSKETNDKQLADEKNRLDRIKEYARIIGDISLKLIDRIDQRRQEQLNTNIEKTNEAATKQLQQLEDRYNFESGNYTKLSARDRAYQKEKLRLEKERDDAIKKLKHDDFEREKNAQILKTNIAGAVAAIEALPNYILSAAVGVTTAIELAFIASQPNPYAKGSPFVDKEGKYKRGVDSVPAILMPGERVVTVEDNKKHWQLLEATRTGKVNEFINYKYINPALKKQKEQFQQQTMLGLLGGGGAFNDGNIVSELRKATKVSQKNTYELAKVFKSNRKAWEV